MALGEPDTANDYPYVAKLKVDDANGTFGCSGILITPGLILTANHCIRDYWYQVAEPVVDHSDSDWTILLGDGPAEESLTISRPHTYERVHRGVTFTYPIDSGEMLGHVLDAFTKDEPSQDLTIIRLDQRVPLSQVTPMHVPAPALGYPSCTDEYGDGSFEGILIGFGGCGAWDTNVNCGDPRNFNSVGNWKREDTRPVWPYEIEWLPGPPPGPNLEEWGACEANGGYVTLPDLLCLKDLPGTLYSTYWTTAGLPVYNGIMAGDSGGPLVTEEVFTNLLPGNHPAVGNPGGRMLCGVGCRAYPVLPHDVYQPDTPAYLQLVLGNDYPAVDGLNSSWLLSQVVRGGNFIGECVLPPNHPFADFADIDSDDDLIPDACDPCPRYYDHDYDLSTVPDFDGDGVPDRCDSCPTMENPLQVTADPNDPFVLMLVQADYDQDGYGDTCDKCPFSHLVDVPATANDLFPLPPFTDYTCCTTDADCEPLLCLQMDEREDPGPPSQLCFPGDSRGNIIDQLIASGVSWQMCENHCARPLDLDCDGKGDLCDICPFTFNPSQTDTDGDGVGDKCDNCPGGDESHVEDLNPPCDYFDPFFDGQLFCQSLDPNSDCLPPHPKGEGPSPSDLSRCSWFQDDDSDGTGQACDNCQNTSNPADDWTTPGLPLVKQKNCNRVTEIVQNVPYPYVGDACDRNPCSNFHAYKAIQSQTHYDQMGWVAEVDYGPRLLPFWAPWEGSPPLYGPGFSYNCPATGHCDEPKATTGLRFCSCSELGVDGLPDALSCQSVAGCPLDSGQYYLSVSNWRTPSLLMSGNVIYDPPSSAPYIAGAEVGNQGMINPLPGSASEDGLLAESTPWSSTAYWYAAPDIAAFGGGEPQLTGVVWSHVAWVTLLFPTEVQAEAQYRPTSNHYRGGVFGPAPKEGLIFQPPVMIPLPEWVPFCDPLRWWSETPDEATFVVDANASVVGLRTLVGDLDLTPAVSASAIAALAQPSVRWVGASEPGGTLDGVPGLVSVTTDGLGVTSVLGTQGGQIVSLFGPESPPSPPPPAHARSSFGTALSSTEGSVFVVGGLDVVTQQYPGDVWRYDVPSRTWTQLEIAGAVPEFVLATTFRAQDVALYVADRVGASAPQSRLLRIDLSTRTSTILGQWTATTWDRTYLSNTFDGRLLLVSSATNQLCALAFDPAADLSQATGPSFLSYADRATVVAAPSLTQKGLTLPAASSSEGVVNQFVWLSDLLARPGASDNLIDQCL